MSMKQIWVDECCTLSDGWTETSELCVFLMEVSGREWTRELEKSKKL